MSNTVLKQSTGQPLLIQSQENVLHNALQATLPEMILRDVYKHVLQAHMLTLLSVYVFLSALSVLTTINIIILLVCMNAPHLQCPTNTMEIILVSMPIILDIQGVLLDIGRIPLIICVLLSAQQITLLIKLNNFVFLSALLAILLMRLIEFVKQTVLWHLNSID